MYTLFVSSYPGSVQIWEVKLLRSRQVQLTRVLERMTTTALLELPLGDRGCLAKRGHSLNMTDIPWSLKRNLTTL